MELTLNDNVRRLLQEISEDLCRVMSDSPAFNAKLSELEAEGYSLNLILDCRQTEAGDENRERSSSNESARTSVSPSGSLNSQAQEPAETSSKQTSEQARRPPAEFRIDANDLAFLRSVGIDPTRPGRSKRRRRAETTPSSGS